MNHRKVRIPLIVWMAAVLAASLDVPAHAASERTVTVDGRSRRYLLHVPQDPCEPSPLVLVFHGGGGNAANMTRLGFEPLAQRDGFVVAYPEGVGGHWNDGRQAESLQAQREDVNDVNFVRKVVDAICADQGIDRSRIFATGVSNGGIFCHRLAAEASDLVAAIAPVIGGMAEPIAERFRPAFPVSMLAIQGDADPLVPFGGGEIGLWPSGRRGRIISTTKMVSKYLTLNGIVDEPSMASLPDLDTQDETTTEVTWYPPGPRGFLVRLYVVHGGGHQWPGHGRQATAAFSGKASQDFDATEAICEFFRSCPPRSDPPIGLNDASPPVTSLEEIAGSLAGLAETIRTPIPGEHPAYSPPGIWMLGEILWLKRGVHFDRLIRQELYVPWGMDDCFNGMTDAELQEYTSRIPTAAASSARLRDL